MTTEIIGVSALAAHIQRSRTTASDIARLMLALGEARRYGIRLLVFDADAADRWRDYLAQAQNRGGHDSHITAARYLAWCKSQNCQQKR